MKLMELPLNEFLISVGDGVHDPGVVDEVPKPFPVLIDIDGTEVVDDFNWICEFSDAFL